jgi:hypothetical protein
MTHNVEVREFAGNKRALADNELDNVSGGVNGYNAVQIWHNLLGQYGYPMNDTNWRLDGLRDGEC